MTRIFFFRDYGLRIVYTYYLLSSCLIIPISIFHQAGKHSALPNAQVHESTFLLVQLHYLQWGFYLLSNTIPVHTADGLEIKHRLQDWEWPVIFQERYELLSYNRFDQFSPLQREIIEPFFLLTCHFYYCSLILILKSIIVPGYDSWYTHLLSSRFHPSIIPREYNLSYSKWGGVQGRVHFRCYVCIR